MPRPLLAAPPAAADVRHAYPCEPEGLPMLGSGWNGDLDRAVEGRDLDSVAQRRLDHVHPQLVDAALILPGEVRMRLLPEPRVQVAGPPAPDSGFALTADPDLAA